MTKQTPVAEHSRLIAELREESNHSVRVVPEDHRLVPSQPEYTCFGFAFELADSPEYIRLASRPFAPYADSRFVEYHLASGRLEEIGEGAQVEGDIAVYYTESGALTHAAVLITPGSAISKWGIGLLYQHEIFHVPASYGSTVKYFRGNSREKALASFNEFTENEGFSTGHDEG